VTPYVQKLRVPVRLSQPNQEPRDGWFLLFPGSEGENPESVVELLNSPRVVLPFVHKGDRAVLLLTRQNIDWVAIAADVAEELVLRPGRIVTHSQRVELRFTDETSVDGIIEWDGEHRNLRLSDFLNWCDDFFVLKTGFGTLVVNRQRIRETRLVDPVTPVIEARATKGMPNPAP
jgi:hypothetical protein